MSPTHRQGALTVGKFILGIIVGIVVIIFLVYQCTTGLF